jgi:hypothetical protein
MGLLPTFIWFSFHSNVIQFRQEEFFWVLGLGGVLSLMFTYSLRRGLFSARYFVYLAITFVILAELLKSVSNRDFQNMASSLFFLGGGVLAGLWLEKRIASATVNPECEWFDGNPKVIQSMGATLSVNDRSFQAKIRKIDAEGLFVFLDSPISVKPKQRVRVRIELDGVSVEGDALISSQFLGQKQGLGLQFLKKDLYHSSEYTGMVQHLRGKGL